MKTKLFLFYFILLTFNLLFVATATVRYVSKTGTSTPPYTSWATASDSIQKCINICQDGDTVYVANGVYKENLVIYEEIALIGSSRDSTVIDGMGLGNITITVNASSILENFNIYGKGDSLSGEVSAVFSVATLLIRNCQVSKSWHGINFVSSSLNAENLYMNSLINGFSLLELNPGNCSITNCVIFLRDNKVRGIGVGYAPNSNYHFNNNILIYNRERSNHTGNGIYLSLPGKVYINNNLISGFTNNIQIDNFTDTVFINNDALVYQNTNSSNPACIWNAGGIIVINNVILSNNLIGISTPSEWPWRVKSDYNLFWQNKVDLKGITYGDSDIVADPMFVKDELPDSNLNFDFHLQKYSPAIDRGNHYILDVDGSRSDIGMFGGPLGQVYTYHDLAPKPPRNLTASVQGKAVTPKWNKNTEADLFQYRVYRDTVSNFIYDTTKIITVTADTFFVDILGDEETPNHYFYKITAIDSAIKQSAASEEVQVTLTGMPEMPPIVVEEYKLLQNYPNPFNPSTTIPYRLKSPAYVKIMVYNILGELVRVLVNQYQSAGYYEVDFTPNTKEKTKGKEAIREFETFYYGDVVSGIYLYRIEVIGEGNIPVFSDMKKMMMVK